MKLFRQMPPGVQLWTASGLLATWFGVGLIRIASGTWASLVALPFAGLIVWAAGDMGLLAAAVACFALGLWASSEVGRSGEEDSGAIVIDEVAAQWLVVVPVAFQPEYYLVAFVLFRAFDIAKPWPVGWVDSQLKGPFWGPLGVMADDVLAAAYAAPITWGIAWLIG